MRILKWVGIIGLVLVLSGVFLMMRAKWRTSDAGVNDYFSKRDVPVVLRRIPFSTDSLRLLITGRPVLDTASPLIIFIHGAPGSSDNFHAYLADSTLNAKATLVAFDRPGYGYSDYGRAHVSLKEQAAAVGALLELFPEKRVFLVGHSYGGPIAVRAALDFSSRIGGLLLLAPVQDPVSEPIFWFSWFSYWKATRWMLSGSWRVCGEEKFSHRGELEKLFPDWISLKVPVVHIHGGKDWMAPPANTDFSRRHLAPGLLRLVVWPSEGHLIPFVRFSETRAELLRLLGVKA